MTDFEQQILEYLSAPGYKPRKADSLARKLGVPKSERREFRRTLERLLASGSVLEGKKDRLRPRSAPGMIAGIIKRTRSGAGFLIPHETAPGAPEGDLYIAPEDLGDAHTGDEVVVRLLKRRGRGGRRCGRVEEVLVRSTNTFVGTYAEHEGQGYVTVDGTTFAAPIPVDDPGAKRAHPGDKVVIEMLRFPSHVMPGEAVLTKVLGPRGEPGVDTLSIIHEYGLPDEFPEDVLREASTQVELFDERDLTGRRDLTAETIVTIDPADAHDFDDAISLARSPDGHWHLGVHIADVSHFVEPGSRLDREALRRGNSVYLPDRVLPMLPEVLSNGLASLQMGKVRFTKSVLMEFDAAGVPLHSEFVDAAIKVTRRFAYEEIMPILENPEKYRSRVPAKVRKLLADMYELAMLLRARRFAHGALELHLPEVKVDLDKQGKVIGAHEVPHDESHQIIEEFMLAANVSVATALADRGLPYLRRVHGDPDIIKLRAFAEFVNALGYRLKQYQSRPHLQELLNSVRGEPTEHAVNYALLRSMKQAEYSGLPLGHYALAVENYCHFTSPIRRYPDLLVHRIVSSLMRDKHPKAADEAELTKLGKHCSFTERRAADAERELTKMKLLAYMSERIGEEMDAIITGVEQFGIFCQGIEIPVEGMVHISALDVDDFFDYDAAAFRLVGRRKGKEYRLGDRIRVAVAHVDIERRQLDFRLVAVVAPRKAATGRRAEKPDRGDGGARDGRAGRRGSGGGGRRGAARGGTSPRGRRGKRRRR